MARDDRTVLVVDDDLDLREALELILEDRGYRVVSASNGREALERLARERPVAILLDMRMPEMDGWQFARELRKHRRGRIPIVVCTSAEDARIRAAEVEADGYLEKPFEIDEVLTVLGAVAGLPPICGR
jgi:CheY-like chemotaxis protein